MNGHVNNSNEKIKNYGCISKKHLCTCIIPFGTFL